MAADAHGAGLFQQCSLLIEQRSVGDDREQTIVNAGKLGCKLIDVAGRDRLRAELAKLPAWTDRASDEADEGSS
jgi:hypothetical protein